MLRLNQELQESGFATVDTFFEGGTTANDLAARLLHSHPDRLIWYCPQKLSGKVAPRLRDAGLSIIGVNDSGFAGIHCQYEVRRQPALAKIVAEWKKEGIALVKVVVGPTRSAADEERIGRTLESLEVGARFVVYRSQALRHWVNSMTNGTKSGLVLLNSAASLLATRAPDAFTRLAELSRVALVDGPVSAPIVKSTNAVVDLVMVDWEAAAKRIVRDLRTRRPSTFDQPSLFEAKALFRVPLGQHAQSF